MVAIIFGIFITLFSQFVQGLALLTSNQWSLYVIATFLVLTNVVFRLRAIFIYALVLFLLTPDTMLALTNNGNILWIIFNIYIVIYIIYYNIYYIM